MNILITGSAGFIGFHTSLKLIEKKCQLFGIDNINNYYDKKIKYDRLKILKKNKNFNFKKLDITNYKNIFNYVKKIKLNI